jgi:hypothetical protein
MDYMTNEPKVLQGRDDVVEVVLALVDELRTGRPEFGPWGNDTLDSYLEGLAYSLNAIENHYYNTDQPLPDNAWVLMIDALRSARHYD